MRDSRRRRNYSVEAAEFRKEHEERRVCGLRQRHARRLTRLYGNLAHAAVVFQRRAEEAISAPSSVPSASPARPASTELAPLTPAQPEPPAQTVPPEPPAETDPATVNPSSSNASPT